jgi:hypothetical protein
VSAAAATWLEMLRSQQPMEVENSGNKCLLSSAVPRVDAAALSFDIDVSGGSCEDLGRWRILDPSGRERREEIAAACWFPNWASVHGQELHISFFRLELQASDGL